MGEEEEGKLKSPSKDDIWPASAKELAANSGVKKSQEENLPRKSAPLKRNEYGLPDPTELVATIDTWTDYEQLMFLKARTSNGIDFPAIGKCIPTRTDEEVRVYHWAWSKCPEV